MFKYSKPINELIRINKNVSKKIRFLFKFSENFLKQLKKFKDIRLTNVMSRKNVKVSKKLIL